MPDRQTRFDGIFPFQDMDIGAADGGCRDFDQRFAGTGFGDRFFIQYDFAGFDENGRFHGTHRMLLPYRFGNRTQNPVLHPADNTETTGRLRLCRCYPQGKSGYGTGAPLSYRVPAGHVSVQ